MPDTDDVYHELPVLAEHGTEATWIFQDQNNHTVQIRGQFLGMGSSHRPEHKGHAPGTWAPRGTHCSTCRWTEVRLFRSDDGLFHVVHCGASDVPGERDLIRSARFSTPFEVVEGLTAQDRDTQRRVLPFPARNALAQAASHDAQMRDVYINSPVT